MGINIVSGSGGFDPFKYHNLNSLQHELDDSANTFLKEEIENAVHRLDSGTQMVSNLPKDLREKEIGKEQESLNELFTERREELRAHLNQEYVPNQLSKEEIDLYLNNFESAWKKNFDLQSHVTAYLSDHGPVQTQSPMQLFQKGSVPPSTKKLGSYDPGLDQALQEANDWLQIPLFWGQKNLVDALIQEIQNLKGSGGTMADLQTWVNGFWSGAGAGDLFFYVAPNGDRTYAGINEADVTKLFNICKSTPPTFSKMDDLVSQTSVWLLHPSSSASVPLCDDLLKEIWAEGPNGSPSAVTAWAQQIVDSNFANYQTIFQDTPSVVTFLQITGAQPSLAVALSEAEYQQSIQSGSNANLYNDLIAEIKSLMAQGKSFSDLQTWFTSKFGTADIYMQYPGVSSQAAQSFYDITLEGTPPPPTTMDNLYLQVYNWSQGLTGDDRAAATQLLNQIYTVGSQATQSELTLAVENMYGIRDIYMQNPNASQNTINQFYAFLGLSAPAKTAMDMQYELALSWLHSIQPPSGAEYTLAQALVNEIYTIGSPDPGLNNVFLWAKDYTENSGSIYYDMGKQAQEYFLQYSGLTSAALAPILQEALQWRHSASGDNYNLLNALVNQIYIMRASGTQSGLASGINGLFSKQDVYMMYPEATQDIINEVYSVSQAGTPPGTAPTMTAMDTEYRLAYNWLHSEPPLTGPDLTLAQNLVKEMYSLGSSAQLSDVATWAKQTYTEVSGSGYFASSEQAQEYFLQYSGITSAALAPALQQLLQWRSQASGDNYNLLNALVSQVYTLGSTGTQNALTNAINSLFSKQDVYMQYPEATQDIIKEVYSVSQAGTPPGTAPTMTAMDTEYLLAYKWLHSDPPLTGPDLILAQNLVKEMYSRGSSAPLSDLAAWAKQTYTEVSGSGYFASSEQAQEYFLQYSGITSEALAHTLQQLLQWRSQASGENYNLLNSLVSQVYTLGSTGTQSALANAINSLFSNQDVYMQYPEATQDIINEVYSVTQAGTPPGTATMTAMDTEYRLAYNWVHGDHPPTGPDLTFAEQLVSDIYNFGSNRSIDEFAAQEKQTYTEKSDSAYFTSGISAQAQEYFLQYSGITSGALAHALQQLLQWRSQASGDNYNLLNALVNQVYTLGSTGTQSALTNAINSLFSNQDVYMQYPEATQDIINEVYSATQAGTPPGTIPTMTAMDTEYRLAYNWVHGDHPPTGPDLTFAEQLVSDIYNFGSNRSIDLFAAQEEQTYTEKSDSAYFTSGISAQAQEYFLQYSGITSAALAPTLQQLLQWRSQASGDNYNLLNALVNQVYQLHSTGTQSALANAINSLFSNQDVYMQYPEATQDIINEIYSISQAGIPPGTVPTMTAMDTEYLLAYKWLHSGLPPADSTLAQDLVNDIYNFGSNRSIDEFAAQEKQKYTEASGSPYFTSGISAQAQEYFLQYSGITSAALAPTLQQLLQWRSQASGDNYNLLNALVNQVYQLHSTGTQSALANAINSLFSNQDVYMQYPEATQDTINEVYSISQAGTPPGTAPPITAMDAEYLLAYKWLHSGLPPADSTLAQDLVNDIYNFGSNRSIDEFAAQEKQKYTEASGSPYFTPGVSAAAQEYFLQYSGITSAALAPTLQQLLQWRSQASGDNYNLLNALVNQVYYLKSTGTQSALANAINSLFANQDVYMQYPEATQDTINEVYSVSQAGTPPGTAPTMTAMDTEYRLAYNWLHSGLPPADATLAQDLVKGIYSLGSAAQLSDLATWAEQNYTEVGKSDYFAPGVSATAQKYFLQYSGITSASLADTLQQLLQLRSQASGDDYNLLAALVNQVYILGSTGTQSALTNAINSLFSKQDVYMQYPGASQDTINEVYSASQAGTPPGTAPPMTAMDTEYRLVYQWLHSGLPPADATLAQDLMREMYSLGSSAPLSDLTTWAEQNYTEAGKSDYFAPGVSATAQKYFLQYSGITSASLADTLQKLLMLRIPRTGSNYTLMSDLIKEIYRLGTGGSPDQLADWVKNTYLTNPAAIFYTGNADESVKEIFLIYSGLTSTSLAPALVQALDWRNGPPPPQGIDYKLSNDLVTELFTLGATGGTFAQLTAWAQAIVNGNFSNYPGVSNSAIVTFESITGVAPLDPFVGIKADIQVYLSQREQAFSNLLSILHQPYPQTPAQWQTLIALCGTLANKLQSAMAMCHTDADWIQLGKTFGFSGTAQQIQAAANARLAAYQGVQGYQSAVALFTNALNEITTLESEHEPFSALNTWASGVNLNNYPGLTAADMQEFDKLRVI